MNPSIFSPVLFIITYFPYLNHFRSTVLRHLFTTTVPFSTIVPARRPDYRVK